MKMWKAATLCVVGSSITISAALSQQAQPQQQPQTQPQPRPGVQVQVSPNRQAQPQSGQTHAQHHAVSEQSMAACVAIANQEEIALARLAADKTKNEDVQKFAKMVIEDHQEFLKKLQRFTPEARQETLMHTASTDRSDVTTANGQNSNQDRSRQGQDNDRDNRNDRNDRSERQAQPQAQPQPQAQGQGQGQSRQPQAQGIQQTGAQAAAGSVEMLQLHREMAQQCLNDSKKKLSEKEGAEFDACFMGQQVGKHAAMATALTVLKRHASGELAQVLDEGLKTTESHLEHAEKILDGLVTIEKSDSASDRSKASDRTRDRDANKEKNAKE